MIPLHVLHSKLEDDLCHILMKAHIMTGDDALIKVGTKHATLAPKPIQLLSNFGESPEFSDEDTFV